MKNDYIKLLAKEIHKRRYDRQYARRGSIPLWTVSEIRAAKAEADALITGFANNTGEKQ